MSKKVQISKITIELNGKKVELTVSEAKELYSQLDSLFGVKYIPSAPNVWPERIFPNTPKWGNPLEITC